MTTFLLAIAGLVTLLVCVVTLVFLAGKFENAELPNPEAARPLSRKEERERAYKAKLAARRAARKAESEAREAEERRALAKADRERPPREEPALNAEQEEVLRLNVGEFINSVKDKQTLITFERIALEFPCVSVYPDGASACLRALVADGSITGIVDDEREFFLYMSGETMRDVARLIQERGRIGLRELADMVSA